MTDCHRYGGLSTTLRQSRRTNTALVPGNLLSKKCVWQAIANRLPRNAVLIVVPTNNASQKATLLTVAKLLGQAGHQVRVIPVNEVLQEA
jgi:hypothetical protein